MKKKQNFLNSPLLLMLLFLVFAGSCKTDDNGNNINIPRLTTTVITDITQTTAKSGGNITSDGFAPVTASGVCWSIGQTPTISDNKTIDGTATGSFTSNISGLTANTTYNLRAYATNSYGTGYGSVMTFSTQNSTIVFNPDLTYGTMTDIDGNIYKTITIGSQTWMAENLKVTHYNDGTAIPYPTESEWGNLTTGALCNYENSQINSETYGRLYNWHTVNTGKLCPTGWHVPSDVEWTTLTDYLDGIYNAGGKLKEIGTIHWESPNEGAINSSGFTAIPGGARNFVGIFGSIGFFGGWWSSSEVGPDNAYGRSMDFDKIEVGRSSWPKQVGFSVRCVKD